MTIATDAASAYFQAWHAKDSSILRPYLAEDVEFIGSMAHVNGADEYARSIQPLFEATTQLAVKHVFADGDDVLTWFEMQIGTAPVTPVANWCHVDGGLITRVLVVFDPRGMLSST
jgi:ketosteroid isomerase-like protein